MRQREWLRKFGLFWGAFLVILAVFFWTENDVSPSFQSCISQTSGEQNTKGPEKKINVVGHFVVSESICTLRFIDRHNGFFAAVAAFIVAWFAFTLRQAVAELWKTEERNFRAAQRAFVSLDGFAVELRTAADLKTTEMEGLPELYRNDPEALIFRFAVLPKWKNSGNTPTRNMTIQVNWGGPTGHVPPDYVYTNAPEAFFLAPKAVETSAVVVIPPAPRLVDWGLLPTGVEPMIFIWGRSDYEDTFGRKHFVEWCRQLRFDRPDGKTLRASFVQWGNYNRCDNPGTD